MGARGRAASAARGGTGGAVGPAIGRAAALFGALWAVAARDRYVIAATAAVALLLALPSFLATETALTYSREHYESALELLNDGAFTVDGGPVPQRVQDSIGRRTRLIESILEARDDREYYTAIARYTEHMADTRDPADASYSWDGRYIDLRLMDRARITLAYAIADLAEPAAYHRVSEMPAAFYVPYALSLVPTLLLLLPCAAAACACGRALSGGRALAASPAGPAARLAAAALVALAVCAASLAAACLPGALAALARNGPGDPAYPVVFVSSGQVVQTTAAGAAGRFALLFLAQGLLVSCGLSPLAVFGPGLAIKAAFAAYAAAPLLPAYYGGAVPDRALLALPTTYLDVPRVAGYPDYLPGVDLAPVAGCTLGGGVAVCLAWCAAVAAAAAAAGLASAAAGRWRCRARG